jgi:hypothetical protein
LGIIEELTVEFLISHRLEPNFKTILSEGYRTIISDANRGILLPTRL